jgi:hypothetical protein
MLKFCCNVQWVFCGRISIPRAMQSWPSCRGECPWLSWGVAHGDFRPEFVAVNPFLVRHRCRGSFTPGGSSVGLLVVVVE